jgi:hypothetical protein
MLLFLNYNWYFGFVGVGSTTAVLLIYSKLLTCVTICLQYIQFSIHRNSHMLKRVQSRSTSCSQHRVQSSSICKSCKIEVN